MSEKLSERHLREQKVEALKGKLLKEISFNLEQELFELRSMTEHEIGAYPSFVRESVEKLHNLYAFEDWLKNNEGAFMHCSFSDERFDLVEYTVDEDTLDWMMQEEGLVSKVVFQALSRGRLLEMMLSDKFFEYQLFRPFERMAWEDRKTKANLVVDEVLSDAKTRTRESAVREPEQEIEI